MTSSSGSPCQRIATLSAIGVPRCRSRQFAATFNWPSSNQVCWISRSWVFQVNFRATVGFLIQVSVAACSSQKASASFTDRWYICWYCSALRCARPTTSAAGGKLRVSVISESVEIVFFCCSLMSGVDLLLGLIWTGGQLTRTHGPLSSPPRPASPAPPKHDPAAVGSWTSVLAGVS